MEFLLRQNLPANVVNIRAASNYHGGFQFIAHCLHEKAYSLPSISECRTDNVATHQDAIRTQGNVL
jgi:hypothetical protein